jgi:hypothetical protein
LIHDYNVLHTFIGGDAWAAKVSARYRDGGYNGLFLTVQKDTKVGSLEDLLELPSLEYLNVTGRVKDDTAAFEVASLKELTLLTRCNVPVPLSLSSNSMGRLGIDDRPGKETVAALPSLRTLFISSWRTPDLSDLSAARGLTTLRLEGYEQTIRLDGIEGCTALEELHVDVMQVESLAPLTALSRLRKLWIITNPTKPSDVILDLNAVADLPQLQEVRLTFGGGIRTLDPVRRMTELRDLRLRGTTIVDDDLSPLTELGPDVAVVGPNE